MIEDLVGPSLQFILQHLNEEEREVRRRGSAKTKDNLLSIITGSWSTSSSCDIPLFEPYPNNLVKLYDSVQMCLFQTIFCFIIMGHIRRVCGYEKRFYGLLWDSNIN